MRLTFSDPVAVAVGPDSRTAGWGIYQFPCIDRLDDGTLVYTFAECADSETAYGSEPGCCVSTDNGVTWRRDRVGRYENRMGVRLPNGDLLKLHVRSSIPMEGLELPEPIGKTWLGHTIYWMKDVHCCDNTWHFIRVNAENPEGKDERVELHWPHMIVRSCRGVLVPPSPRGRLRVAPDGTLWMPHYYLAGTNPENGGFVPYLCNYLFRSTDAGRTWDLVNWLPYVPDTDVDPLAFAYEGYGENDITFAPDGSMIRLIRTDGCYPRKGPCYFTRSTDGGVHWSAPEKFDDHGVWPCLLTLGCGVTLASYGRPGLQVRATADPACLRWEEPVELVHSSGLPETDGGSVLEKATCSYSNMIALDSRTAAIVYSDFTYRDAEGVPHKTMMYRTITVEDV